MSASLLAIRLRVKTSLIIAMRLLRLMQIPIAINKWALSFSMVHFYKMLNVHALVMSGGRM